MKEFLLLIPLKFGFGGGGGEEINFPMVLYETSNWITNVPAADYHLNVFLRRAIVSLLRPSRT